MEKPKDWSDPAGWDRYYSELLDEGDYSADIRDTGTISIDRIPQLISELRSMPLDTVWIPGCGISLLPKLLCRGGLQVHATDVSRRAVEFQNADIPKVADILSKSGIEESAGGKFVAEVHDFRSKYLIEKFDVIINVKAFQAFPEEEMREVGAVHFAALKRGGRAIFDTLNVQGERRELLESVLVGAGFYLPFYEANVEYRRQLNETAIPYVFVLGRPIIPWHGEYAENETKREAGMAELREITARHLENVKSEAEPVALHYKNNPETKTVSIFYSTG